MAKAIRKGKYFIFSLHAKDMQNSTQDVKGKIIEIIKRKGPSLPVEIARETGLSPLFASAFLSELVKSGMLRLSHLKIGGSPLYFLPGQEKQLENFVNHLHEREREALVLLKSKLVLKDKELLPATRVALRNLKDFAFPIAYKQELYWKYLGVTNEQALGLIKKISAKREVAKKQELIYAKEKNEKKETERKIITKKKKEESDFVVLVRSYLEKREIRIIKEIEKKKKEFSAVVSADSRVGEIKFYMTAKDKKRISENDLALLLQKAQAERMPALLLHRGKLNKKAKSYAEKWQTLLRVMKIE